MLCRINQRKIRVLCIPWVIRSVFFATTGGDAAGARGERASSMGDPRRCLYNVSQNSTPFSKMGGCPRAVRAALSRSACMGRECPQYCFKTLQRGG